MEIRDGLASLANTAHFPAFVPELIQLVAWQIVNIGLHRFVFPLNAIDDWTAYHRERHIDFPMPDMAAFNCPSAISCPTPNTSSITAITAIQISDFFITALDGLRSETEAGHCSESASLVAIQPTCCFVNLLPCFQCSSRHLAFSDCSATKANYGDSKSRIQNFGIPCAVIRGMLNLRHRKVTIISKVATLESTKLMFPYVTAFRLCCVQRKGLHPRLSDAESL